MTLDRKCPGRLTLYLTLRVGSGWNTFVDRQLDHDNIPSPRGVACRRKTGNRRALSSRAQVSGLCVGGKRAPNPPSHAGRLRCSILALAIIRAPTVGCRIPRICSRREVAQVLALALPPRPWTLGGSNQCPIFDVTRSPLDWSVWMECNQVSMIEFSINKFFKICFVLLSPNCAGIA